MNMRKFFPDYAGRPGDHGNVFMSNLLYQNYDDGLRDICRTIFVSRRHTAE